MTGPVATLLPDGKRLHLQHGPIDLIIGADGERDKAFAAAARRFQHILTELVAELPLLRRALRVNAPLPAGSVAKRMDGAVRPYAAEGFVTSMAAVAGSVADEVLQAMCDGAQLQRAFVNNGGDIALHLTKDARFSMAMAGHDGRDLGRIKITYDDPVRGIATSGRHGRSHSLGIADSVTVLAHSAAEADVAATLIANHVDLPDHPAVQRSPASQISEDSDLGDLPVVTHCGPLSEKEIDVALGAGLSRARFYAKDQRISAACLVLQNQSRMTETLNFQIDQRIADYA